MRFFSMLLALNIGFINVAKAEKSVQDTIIDTLTNLTCETQGVGDLLRSEFSHTCIPAPFFTFLVANIVAPLTYANTMLRLKINEESMFPNNCERNSRADPKDPTISFALCSNVKLALVSVEAIGTSVIAIAKAMFTGDDPWQDIKNAWTIDKERYHNVYREKREGESDVMWDAGVPPFIPWKIIKEKDRICVATTTIVFDWIEVGCKYIKEPFPKSMYGNFMDGNPISNSSGATDPRGLTACNNSGGCYQRAYDNSKTGIVITSPLIECVREMAARLLVSKEVCTFDDINSVVNTAARSSSTFFQFQRGMHRAVAAFLTLYVMLFGFKIVLTGDVPPKAELINFVFKVIFVIYFSVGINITPYSGSDYDRLDGMIQWVFPFLLGGIHQIANWIMSAAPSDLCKFNPAEYASGLQHISLWDALDCRISHYLGLDILKTMLIENSSRSLDPAKLANFDFFSFSVPPYYYLLIPAVISGNMTLVSLALMYPLLVISVGAYLVNATVVCMISIVILGVLAPLFVPMLLFNYTRGYFDAWVKLLISFTLQPMVAVTFILTMFSIYDSGFYGKCRYKSSTVTSETRQTKIFYIDNDWDTYPLDVSNNIDDAKDCKNSLGYILNNPVASLYDFSKEALGDIIPKPKNKAEEYMSQFAFLAAIGMSPSLFFISPKLAFEKIKDLILALITACFTLYLMYNFSAQLSEFAADMTEGVSLSGVTINPQTLFKAGMAALGAVTGAGKAGGGGVARKALGAATDKLSGSVDEAQDSIATDTETSDKISSPQTPSFKKAEVGSEAKETAKTSKISIGAHREKRLAAVDTESSIEVSGNSLLAKEGDGSGLSVPRAEAPYVPMDKLNSVDVQENLSSFFKEKNIQASSLEGFSQNEFARYVAFSSEQNKSDKVSGTYEAMLGRTLDNPQMKGHEADYINKIEGMFSGTQLQKIASINDKILKSKGVPRKLLEGQKSSPAGDSKDQSAEGSQAKGADKQLALEWKNDASENTDKKPPSSWSKGIVKNPTGTENKGAAQNDGKNPPTKGGGNDKK